MDCSGQSQSVTHTQRDRAGRGRSTYDREWSPSLHYKTGPRRADPVRSCLGRESDLEATDVSRSIAGISLWCRYDRSGTTLGDPARATISDNSADDSPPSSRVLTCAT